MDARNTGVLSLCNEGKYSVIGTQFDEAKKKRDNGNCPHAISELEDHNEHFVHDPFRDLVRDDYFALFGVGYAPAWVNFEAMQMPLS